MQFSPIFRYILETVRDRAVVSLLYGT